MISIEQWRAVIGSFRAVVTCRCPAKDHGVGDSAARIFVLLSVLWCSFVICTVCLYNVSKVLLICSNDIELNPGPVIYKTCPNCGNKAVHIKRNCVLVDTFFIKKLVRAVQFQVLMVLLITILAPACAIKTVP